jgi:phenylacetate-CoA ligase
MRLIHTAREMGVDLLADANVKIIMAGGEPRPAATTLAISESFGARVYNAAGTTEFGTICMFQCEAQTGCHIIESGMVDEVLDPDTKRPVGYGERGIRVTTGLGREGIQLFRHWTDDEVVRMPWHECGCGRTWDMYDGGILGRRDDMHKIRGVSVTPVMIEDVMRRFGEIADYQTVLRTIDGLDTIVMKVEPQPGADVDPAALAVRISDDMKHEIGIRPEVELAASGSLPRFEVKAARFHDERSR